jgi:hypothetical protein
MRLFNGFGCFLCGSLAVLLCAAPANPDRHVKAALAPLDAMAARAHSDAALASAELRTAFADPAAKATVADPVIKVPLAGAEANVSPLEASDECVLSEECIDQYLWSVYERAPKLDTIKVEEQIKTTVKKNGKSRTVTKTVTKFVNEDFTWKDPQAAEKAGMSVPQYVIGGIDRADRKRQQGREQSLLPWRKPARRLWQRACSRYRERQGRDAFRAMYFKRNSVEVGRRARQGIWDRATLSR